MAWFIKSIRNSAGGTEEGHEPPLWEYSSRSRPEMGTSQKSCASVLLACKLRYLTVLLQYDYCYVIHQVKSGSLVHDDRLRPAYDWYVSWTALSTELKLQRWTLCGKRNLMCLCATLSYRIICLMYRAIHKSLRNFRTRQRNNQDRHQGWTYRAPVR